VLLFSLGGDHGADGAYVSEETVFMRRGGSSQPAVTVGDIPLRGRHNVANVAAAAAVAVACDIEPEAVGRAVRAFIAPAHRLELVGRVRGVAYYNDSIATAPERTLAALHSFEEPIVLLLGGRDKDLPLEEMLTEAKRVCRAVVCFGEAGPLFAETAAALGLSVLRVTTVAEALAAASRLAQPGDVVLLAPAGTSFDAYDSFEQRGYEFRRLVQEMETQS
jgi:UDP-N-acetylmuramoylalanine--D-glutamate ligase